MFAENGHLESAEYLAEILALAGPLHDAEAAYKWYYIVLSEQGYSVEFADQNETSPYYGGPDGDFRNESMVSALVEVALEHPEKSPRELAWHITDTEKTFISESSVYRILKSYDLITSPNYIVNAAADVFTQKTKRPNEMWQTDFTYFKIIGWGWYYLGTVMDDYSRKILAWKLFSTMGARDVQELLDMAIAETGVSFAKVRHKPRLLSDNGPCYIAEELRNYLEERGIRHIRGRPHHPQTQGKIERYHRTMKNVIKLQNYYFPEELMREIERFVHYDNEERYYESLDNLTPADVYSGKRREILDERRMIKIQTLQKRRFAAPPQKTT